MLWLYLLGAVTILVIVVRRLRHGQKPLADELHAKRIVIDHISSGVAWVLPRGALGSVNPALAAMLGETQQEMTGREWLDMFPGDERGRVEEAYRQMLLAGIASINTVRFDGRGAPLARVVLVAVHDHKTRLMGHYCIIEGIVEAASQARSDNRMAFVNMTA